MSKGGGGGGSEKYQEAIDNQYAYDQEMWSFNWADVNDSYNYQLENIAIQEINDTTLRNYQDQTNQNGWINRENIRLYEYDQEVRAYNASVNAYRQQLDYNNLAAEIALNDANRVYQEQLIAFGFQNQDLLMHFHSITF